MNTIVKHQTGISVKNSCVQFLLAYQQQDIDKMLQYCATDSTIDFESLGENGKGKIHELGKNIWTALIDCFPDLDNTLDAAVSEEEHIVRCQVLISGTQKKDFAGIPSKQKHFDSDHIFIFRLNENNQIDHLSISWDHADLVRQLS